MKELTSIIGHLTQKQEGRTYSRKALEEVKGVIEEFATIFSRCLVSLTSEAQFLRSFARMSFSMAAGGLPEKRIAINDCRKC